MWPTDLAYPSTKPSNAQTDKQSWLTCFICKLTFEPLNQITDKNVKQNWPEDWNLQDATGDWLPTGLSCIHYDYLSLAIQPVLHQVEPQKNSFSRRMVSNTTKIQVNNIHSLSIIY